MLHKRRMHLPQRIVWNEEESSCTAIDEIPQVPRVHLKALECFAVEEAEYVEFDFG